MGVEKNGIIFVKVASTYMRMSLTSLRLLARFAPEGCPGVLAL